MIDVAMLEEICPLGLACEIMTGEMSADCPNQEACFNWAQSWDLYEIVWLKGLPPMFVLSNADYDQWCEGYGFFRFDDKDFLLWYAAKFNGFEAWRTVFDKFESGYFRKRRIYPYFRESDRAFVEKLRELFMCENRCEGEIPF